MANQTSANCPPTATSHIICPSGNLKWPVRDSKSSKWPQFISEAVFVLHPAHKSYSRYKALWTIHIFCSIYNSYHIFNIRFEISQKNPHKILKKRELLPCGYKSVHNSWSLYPCLIKLITYSKEWQRTWTWRKTIAKNSVSTKIKELVVVCNNTNDTKKSSETQNLPIHVWSEQSWIYI